MKKIICFLIVLLLLTGIIYAAVDTLEGEELTDAANIEGVTTTDTVEGQVLKAAGNGGITFVQCALATQSWGTTIVVSISPAEGNLLFYGASYKDGDVPTGDVETNTSQGFTEIDAVDGTDSELWTGFIASADAGVTSVTLTWGADGYGVGFVCEFSGIASPVVDDNDPDIGVGASPTTLESTNTANDALFIALYGSANTAVYTEDINQAGSTPATWIRPANGSYPNNPDIDAGGGLVYLIVNSQSARDHVWLTSESNTWTTANTVFTD